MFARTDRLLLRPCWPEDAQELYYAIADEAIVRNLARAPWPYSESEAERFVALKHSETYPTFLLMKRTDGAPRLIGACGLGKHGEVAELGYWISRAHWGSGYATEAAHATIGIAKAIGHQNLVASHFTDNPASGRVLHKAGFRPTGRIVQRHSLGRGSSAECVLYECSLTGDDDGTVTRMPVAPALVGYDRLRAA